jgi:predicted Zn-dependent protease
MHFSHHRTHSGLISLALILLLTTCAEVPVTHRKSLRLVPQSQLTSMSLQEYSSVGILLPYSRMHESEADHIGLMLTARAGYDPREAVPFWKRMNEKGGSSPPEFLSTHPAPASRIEDIEKYIPEAMPYYSASRK